MFQSFLFNFASVPIKNHQTTKIKDYPTLKVMVGSMFTEHYFFYKLVNGCFSKTYRKLLSGQDLKKILVDGEPDFYVRQRKNIFLFEFKDIMLILKQSIVRIIGQIKSEIHQLFECSTIEKNTGKTQKAPQPKGITQLLNVINLS